jgi:hypothetical protein
MNRFTLSRRHRPGTKRPARARPVLELLEDRTVLSTLIVLNNFDSGAGSLRDTIKVASSGDTILFDSSLIGQTITLTSGELEITKSLDIEGLGPDKLTISGNDHSRVFDIDPPGKNVTIAGMTIAHGLADKDSPDVPSLGGGILNSGDLTLSKVVVSDCLAKGDANANPYKMGQGFASGGGVYNGGTLKVSDNRFTGNQALGGSGSSASSGDTNTFIFTGAAYGGGLANTGAVTVTNSQFNGNLAQGGDHCNVPSFLFAGGGSGGAISSVGISHHATLDVSGSSFTNNQAIGGNDNVSIRVPGIALGGAIFSHRFGHGAVLNVSDSTFGYNQAIGGNDNQQTGPVSVAFAPNIGSGGAVVIVGTAHTISTISDSTFDHNQAIGGQGLAGSNVAGVGEGHGGGITVGFAGTEVTVTNSTFDLNRAIGGQAVAGGKGGDARGGGIFNEAGAALTVTHCIIDQNQAQGGSADTSGPPNNGGSGLGGGVYNDEVSTIALTDSSITRNRAIGASGSNGGSDGLGIGGGIYSIGVLNCFGTNVITKNHASTSNDDIFSS